MKIHHAIFLSCSLTCLAATADELSKKIDIDRDVVPELRAASRLNLSPITLSPAIAPVSINEANYLKTSKIPTLVDTFEPATPDEAVALSIQRGYATLGIFPGFCADLSAGYRFVDTPSTRVNAWLQYDLTTYRHTLPLADHNSTFNDNSVAVGVDFSHRIENVGSVSVTAEYDFSRFNLPWVATDSVQRFSRFSLAAAWTSKFSRFDYAIRARFVHDSFAKGERWYDQPLQSLGENILDLSGDASTSVVTGQKAELGVRLLLDNFNRGVGTIGLFGLNPRYRVTGDIFEARLGMKIDFSLNSGRGLAVAPDIKLSANPSSMFSAYVALGGGLVCNTLGSLFDECHYVSSTVAYGNSRLPLAVDAGVGFGPYRGAYLQVFGGYAVADGWLMPTMLDGKHIFESVDMKGWHFGVKASYAFRKLATLELSFEGAPSKYDRGYYLWRDRAKGVFDINFVAHPLERLDLSAGYSLRTGRTAFVSPQVTSAGFSITEGEPIPGANMLKVDLRNAANLYAGARYAFNSQLSAFLRMQNLLNSHHYVVAGVPSQGITGLVGASYKF